MQQQDLISLFARMWSAACQDRPERPSCRVEDGYFVMTITGNQERWAEFTKLHGVPSNAEQSVDGDVLTCRWPSLADQIFGKGGLIDRALPSYEVRLPQLHMARLIQRSIEMRIPATIEAGTGTGKSYAYAAICMAMNKRVVISTSNKALQMQLYKKDIPFLQSIFPGKKVALVQGKQNYACRHKVEDVTTGTYTVGGELLEWYIGTTTGNTEEIPFAVEYDDLKGMVVDGYCGSKHCPRYEDCFYYAAKRARAEADVLITNHMLLALNELYGGAGILPGVDVIVVDEAHQFASYVQNAVGVDLGLSTIEKRLKLIDDTDYADDVYDWKVVFFRDVAARVGSKPDRAIAVEQDRVFQSGRNLADRMMRAADELWPEGQLPETSEERRKRTDANTVRNTAEAIRVFSEQAPSGLVRWIQQGNDGSLSCRVVPHSVADHIGRMAGFHRENSPTKQLDHTHCARCGRKLTSETVALLDGKPYGPDCIRHVDLMGDAEHVSLAEWLNQEPAEPTISHSDLATPVIFASATLAAPDMSAFMREAGLPYALQMVAASPFDYEANALLYVPSAADAPAPTKGNEYRNWLVDEMERLVKASDGGAFLLFTSYDSMRFVSQRLRWPFEQRGYEVFIQGQLPKLEIVKRFMATQKGVLFATKSFWEGVSIDGDALRLVVIDKIPFEAPSPLNAAQEAALTQWAREQGMSDKEAEWYPFEHLRVPRAIIDLKQGTGRLIRTGTDWGVIAILDSRLRSAQYARRLILPSLPPARLTGHIYMVDEFFYSRKNATRLVDLTPVEQVAAIVDIEELPF